MVRVRVLFSEISLISGAGGPALRDGGLVSTDFSRHA